MSTLALVLAACSFDPSLRSTPSEGTGRVTHDHYRLWYRDSDADGHGDPAVTSRALTRPLGYVANATDCNDHNAAIAPTAPEVCVDNIDNNCDGERDEDCAIGVEEAYLTVDIDDQDARLGERMASADLDADGTADLAIGAQGGLSTPDGSVYLLYGPATGSVAAHDLVSISLSSTTAYAHFGSGVGAGDANGDGLDDLLIGADNIDEYYLFLGPVTADRSSADADAELVAYTPSSGQSVDIVGDHDGDGTNDLALGAADTGGGKLYIAPGTTSGIHDLPSEATYVYSGTLGGGLGAPVDTGDVNGDGVTDLAMGDGSACYMVEGGAPAGDYDVSDIATAMVSDPVPGSYFACSSIEGGDYDGDGASDLLVGSIFSDSPPSAPLAGIVYGFLGPLSGTVLVRDAAVRWESPSLTLSLGWSVVADDLDGDVGLDVAMGAPFASTVFVQLGYATGVVDVATLPYVRARAVGDAPNFGTSITTIPDWTGDGGSELALAGPTIDTSSAEDAGIVYVFSSDIF